MIFRKTIQKPSPSEETRFAFLNKASSCPRLPTTKPSDRVPDTPSTLSPKDYLPLPKDEFVSLIEAYKGVEDAKARYSKILASKSSFEQLNQRFLSSQRQIESKTSDLELHTTALNRHFFRDGYESVGIVIRHTVEQHYRTTRLMQLKAQSDAEINKMKEEYETNKQLLRQKKHYLDTLKQTKKTPTTDLQTASETLAETKVRWADDICHTTVIPCEEESKILWDPTFLIGDAVNVSKRDFDRIVNEMADLFEQVKEQQRELGDETVDWELKRKAMSKVVEEEEFAVEQLHEVIVSLSKVLAGLTLLDATKYWSRIRAWKKGHEFCTIGYKPSEETEKSILEKKRQCVGRLEKQNKKVEKKLATVTKRCRKKSKAQKQTE